MNPAKILCVGSLLVSGFVAVLQGQTPPKDPIDLAQASLEDLMDIKVTSVSKKEEKLSRAAAAIFVISAEDIRRSGATNIPDLLRMAPGVDVEQIDANAWAISIRGFNSRYSNTVLVLIDGRTVYNPAFSGVLWDQLDLPLEDIERIEVIRGPGGTVWGANAVNGVISIITKSTRATKGGLLTAGAGTETRAVGEAQYGGSMGSNATYRAFASYFDIGNSGAPPGEAVDDHWQRSHVGFRTDWDPSTRDSLMTQGDLYANQENQITNSNLVASPISNTFPQTLDVAGGNILALWKHTFAGGSQASFQGYFDDYRRTDLGTPQRVRTFDLDFQHHLAMGNRNDMVWGFGYRSDFTALAVGYPVTFNPASQALNLFNIFVQDEIRISDAISFTIGGKLEHNSDTGFETEPSARLVWAPPARRYTVWAAASKAIRQPSQSDTSVWVNLESFPLSASSQEEVILTGNRHVQAEELRDYEVGFRFELAKTLSFDAATFLSFYHELESSNYQSPVIIPGVPLIVEIPVMFGNGAHAEDFGGEIFLNWKATSFWRVSPGYSYLHAFVREDPNSPGVPEEAVATGFPQNTIQVRSQLNLPKKTEFDQSVYYTARLPGGVIPGHARLDLRLGRPVGEFTEVSLVGQNLLRPRTFEYGDSYGVEGMESVRSVYGKITWRF